MEVSQIPYFATVFGTGRTNNAKSEHSLSHENHPLSLDMANITFITFHALLLKASVASLNNPSW